MKYFSLYVFLFLINLSALFSEVDFGLSTGVSKFTYSGNAPDDSQYETINGLMFSALFDVFIIDDLAVSLQPGYIKKGSLITFYNRFNEKLVDSTFTVAQKCINIPLNFKFYTPSHHFYFLSGLNLDYFYSNTIAKDDMEERDIGEFLNKIDLSMNFGVAYQYFIKYWNFFAELRYTHGLTNMNKSNNFTKTDDYSVYISNFKSSGFILLIGFSFRLF